MSSRTNVHDLIALIGALRLLQEEYHLSLDQLLEALQAAEDAAEACSDPQPETEE